MLTFIAFNSIFKILLAATPIVGITVLGIVICSKIITKKYIKDKSTEKVPHALKVLILKKKKNSVDVGIFENNDDKYTHEMTIQSEKGVASDIKVGDTIWI